MASQSVDDIIKIGMRVYLFKGKEITAMQCASCDGLIGERDMVCPHCGAALLTQRLHEEHTAARAGEPGSDQQASPVRVLAFYEMLVLVVGVGCVLVVAIVGILLGWGMVYLLALSLLVLPGLLLMLGMVARSYRTTKKTIGKMLAGEGHVTHWTYSELEWQQVATRTWQPATKPNKGALVFVCVGLAVCLAVLGSAKSPSGAFLAASVIGGLFALILLVFLVSVMVRWLHQGQSSRDIYLSPSGIILGGWYLDSLSGLYRVEYQTGDLATLLFFIARRGRWSNYTSIMEVVVPYGREEEAQQLVRDFTEKGV